ncbi:glycosyltransferase [Limosilactobacillus reuteri]|uniref:glycosyltransferase n=1 Tax=Limosilactobacillus reuteri TaxID=1598 RepID=UPI001E5A6C0A|nr:glycosyltransferase [Limosilactobacillus reuteri]MCC4323957.1 glycosyltransferase [Limosilactobacillus reuteri]MCC4334308.1 glycosyltransferase [Limosilactobacillus reuteri]
MKVLLVVPSLKKTGVTEVVKSLIYENSQRDQKVEYSLISLKNVDDNNKRFFYNLLGEKLYELNGERILTLSKIFGFRKIVKNIKPDIIHFHSFEADLYSCFLSSKVTKISTAHNNGKEDFQSSYGKLVGSVMAKVQVKIFNRLNTVIAVSNTVKQHFQKIISTRIITILNGVNPNIGEKKVIVQRDALQKLVRPVGIYSGNLNSRKNVDVLFESYKEVNSTKNISSLIVIGDDPQNSHKIIEYKKKYKKYNIMFLGRVNNVYPYLNIADYWISASKNEGLPMAAIEAMSANLDLVLSDIPQHKELKMFQGQTIYFFKNNKKCLMQSVKRYINLWTPKHTSTNNYYYKQFFSSEIMYKKYVHEYINIVTK